MHRFWNVRNVLHRAEDIIVCMVTHHLCIVWCIVWFVWWPTIYVYWHRLRILVRNRLTSWRNKDYICSNRYCLASIVWTEETHSILGCLRAEATPGLRGAPQWSLRNNLDKLWMFNLRGNLNTQAFSSLVSIRKTAAAARIELTTSGSATRLLCHWATAASRL